MFRKVSARIFILSIFIHSKLLKICPLNIYTSQNFTHSVIYPFLALCTSNQSKFVEQIESMALLRDDFNVYEMKDEQDVHENL